MLIMREAAGIRVRAEDIWEISVPAAQYCYKPKAVLKKTVYSKLLAVVIVI